jgi:hypothetical protein
MQAAPESDNGEKKKEEESSFSRVDAPGTREPVREQEARSWMVYKSQVLSLFYLLFKSDCFELSR